MRRCRAVIGALANPLGESVATLGGSISVRSGIRMSMFTKLSQWVVDASMAGELRLNTQLNSTAAPSPHLRKRRLFACIKKKFSTGHRAMMTHETEIGLGTDAMRPF